MKYRFNTQYISLKQWVVDLTNIIFTYTYTGHIHIKIVGCVLKPYKPFVIVWFMHIVQQTTFKKGCMYVYGVLSLSQ